MNHNTQSSSSITLPSFIPAIFFWTICQATFLIGCNDVQWVPPQNPNTTIGPTSELQPSEPGGGTSIPIDGIVTPSPPSTFSTPSTPSRSRSEYTEEFSFRKHRGNLAIAFLFHPETYILDSVFRNLIVPSDPNDYFSKSYARQFADKLFGTENEYKGIHLFAAKNFQPLLNVESRDFLNSDKSDAAYSIKSFLELSYYNLSVKQQNGPPSTPLSTMLEILTIVKRNILNHSYIEAYDKPYNLHIIYFRSERTRTLEAEETSKRADEWRRAVGEPPLQANRTWIHMMLARDPARHVPENYDRLTSALMATSPTFLHDYRSAKDFVDLADFINRLSWKMLLKRRPIENTVRVQINGSEIYGNHFHVSPHPLPPEITINMPPGQEPIIGDQIRVIYEAYSN